MYIYVYIYNISDIHVQCFKAFYSSPFIVVGTIRNTAVPFESSLFSSTSTTPHSTFSDVCFSMQNGTKLENYQARFLVFTFIVNKIHVSHLSLLQRSRSIAMFAVCECERDSHIYSASRQESKFFSFS